MKREWFDFYLSKSKLLPKVQTQTQTQSPNLGSFFCLFLVIFIYIGISEPGEGHKPGPDKRSVFLSIKARAFKWITFHLSKKTRDWVRKVQQHVGVCVFAQLSGSMAHSIVLLLLLC